MFLHLSHFPFVTLLTCHTPHLSRSPLVPIRHTSMMMRLTAPHVFPHSKHSPFSGSICHTSVIRSRQVILASSARVGRLSTTDVPTDR